ncbi:hypothetical protein [Nocardioides panaciterrulae]|uniref:Hemophore-related protein n=1 Tax=Nocardioides panaciterrulae TaxID=661492 RepID=A0A7Y9EA84_9ACTN|nr:hypothetical protein [Nocardioides panaciterrulae]NYD43862.1 hypothetical protein [Nocardioides panaciterrulae]
MKHALIAATLLTVGGLAVGCGGNNSADSASGSASETPSSASTSASAGAGSAQSLCTALSSGASIQNGQDVANFVDTLKQAGTPSDAPAEAKKGFDVYVGVLGKIDPKATAKDLQKMGQVKLSSTEKAEVQQFLGYASQTCAPAAPSGASTDGGNPSGGASSN